ncbi:uncharacterized protein LOC134235105 [Saccostrea cucullata]|uniref:uncharacterized protein LOC134235105 n=1 Tax=Saccostrea cuccullata TaxID=36930 RepID=UPI002ED1EDDC
MSQLEKEYGDLSIAITTHGESWHREIDNLVEKLKAKEAGSSPPIKQLLDEPETVTTIETKYKTNLESVACLSDKEIWSCGDDNTMKLYSINQGSLLKSITTKYTGHTPTPKNQPFDPLEITSDSQSHILTADYKNECVHIIDQDGQFLRNIQCGLSKPIGLSVDTNDNLFVAQSLNTQVKKIKYMYPQ